MKRKSPQASHLRPKARTTLPGPLLALAAAGSCALLAAGSVLFLLRPTWPGVEAAADAPSLPITVGGVAFNVPPGAIRVSGQRRSGAQARLDLAFTWPDLTPPPPRAAKPETANAAIPRDEIFITVTQARQAVALNKRVAEIYARFAEEAAFFGPAGLLGVPFKDGTPYAGEDLLFKAERPEDFVARCTRDRPQVPGTCLLERHVGTAEVTVRFRRDWLAGWDALASGIARLLAKLQGGSAPRGES